MTPSSSSSHRTPYFERCFEKHPILSAFLLFLMVFMAYALATCNDLESEQITAQTQAEANAWEAGYRQGRQAAHCSG